MFSILSQACMKLRKIAGELLKSAEPQLQGQSLPEAGLKQEETFLIRGALLGAVKTIATANKMLDSAPIGPSKEQQSLGVPVNASVLPHVRNVHVECCSLRTPPEAWIT